MKITAKLNKVITTVAATLLLPIFASAATLSAVPSTTTIRVGDTFTVDIRLNTSNALVGTVGIRYLRYNKDLLEVQDANTSVAGIQIQGFPLLDAGATELRNTVDATTGTIWFAQSLPLADPPLPGFANNSAQNLARVTFRALAATATGATTPLAFDFTAGSATDCNVISNGVDVLVQPSALNLSIASNTQGVAPTISQQPQNVTVTAGLNASMSVVANGTAPLTYQWKRGTTNVGTNSPTLSFTPATSANAGSYTVTITNAFGGPIVSSTATLTVNPDIAQPTVSFSAPAANATVTGNAVNVAASASDNVGVVGVQFRVGTTNIGAEDMVAPYQVSWNTTSLANGSYTLSAIARDAAGLSSTVTRTVTVNNGDTTAPTVSISAPAANATVMGTAVTLSATASDNVSVSGVQFRVDGANVGAEDTTSPYSISWNSTTIANGTHSITAVARDAAGNSTTSAARTITVNNPDTVAPTVSISAPAANSSVSGIAVNLSANATDAVGVVGVQFKVDGANVGAEDTAAPYAVVWNSSLVANGAHSITAVARDAAGNSATSIAVNVTVSNLPPNATPVPTSTPNADEDKDGIPDATDNCPKVANADQADRNKNGIGDVCEAKGAKRCSKAGNYSVIPVVRDGLLSVIDPTAAVTSTTAESPILGINQATEDQDAEVVLGKFGADLDIRSDTVLGQLDVALVSAPNGKKLDWAILNQAGKTSKSFVFGRKGAINLACLADNDDLADSLSLRNSKLLIQRAVDGSKTRVNLRKYGLVRGLSCFDIDGDGIDELFIRHDETVTRDGASKVVNRGSVMHLSDHKSFRRIKTGDLGGGFTVADINTDGVLDFCGFLNEKVASRGATINCGRNGAVAKFKVPFTIAAITSGAYFDLGNGQYGEGLAALSGKGDLYLIDKAGNSLLLNEGERSATKIEIPAPKSGEMSETGGGTMERQSPFKFPHCR